MADGERPIVGRSSSPRLSVLVMSAMPISRPERTSCSLMVQPVSEDAIVRHQFFTFFLFPSKIILFLLFLENVCLLRKQTTQYLLHHGQNKYQDGTGNRKSLSLSQLATDIGNVQSFKCLLKPFEDEINYLS